MGKIRSLLSNVNLLNIFLACALLAVAYITFSPGHSGKAGKHVKAAVNKTAEKKETAGAETTAGQEKNPSPADYMVIADENLFHPDRKMPEEKSKQQQAAPLKKPEFVLDGTLMTNGLKIAFIQDKKSPVNTPGRPNRQTPMKIGDAMSGYTLMEIDKDKVVMQRGDDKVEVALESENKANGPPAGKADLQSAVRKGGPSPSPQPARREPGRGFFQRFMQRRR